ncbi:hypothetical protein FACS1894196_4960 [Clostridia bacterium]|nr:hypothetical protein FACS1894196_4960 [Clostridia bacterium]
MEKKAGERSEARERKRDWREREGGSESKRGSGKEGEAEAGSGAGVEAGTEARADVKAEASVDVNTETRAEASVDVNTEADPGGRTNRPRIVEKTEAMETRTRLAWTKADFSRCEVCRVLQVDFCK